MLEKNAQVVVTFNPIASSFDDTINKIEENLKYINIIEYRADLAKEKNREDYCKDIELLKEKFPDLPVMFTYRTTGQGGGGSFEPTEYYELIKFMVERRLIQIVDIELLLYEDLMDDLLKVTRLNQIQVIISHHEFDHTPSTKELRAYYERMKSLGADFCKIAVMPEDGRDVLKLLTAVYETNQNCDAHIVGIAMGEIGKLTRVAGGEFGSALTYGHVGTEAAPGQLHVKDLSAMRSIY